MRLVRFLRAFNCVAAALVLLGGCSSHADRSTMFESSERPANPSQASPTGETGKSASSDEGAATTEGSGGLVVGAVPSTSPHVSAGSDDSAGDYASSSSGSGAVVATADPKAAASADAGAEASASRLTAGLWDDNANYDVFARYWNSARQANANALPQFTDPMTASARDSYAQRRSYPGIDIALMLDTTGSMTDELQYLQSEFLNISREVTQQFPTADVRWSLVAYRDQGDAYVTRPFDFSADVEVFRKNLAAQSADGGGDMPEAVATAFGETLKQSWRGSAAAQMVLWVADAPHHDSDAQSVQSAITKAKDMGIHIYPVASSNANALAEATMRVAAQYTGGRYLFLTDDSGIGGSHAEPKVPCYYVTKFNDAIVRSIGMELTGRYVPPSTQAIVRTVGTPIEATCAPSVVPADAGADAVEFADAAGDHSDAQTMDAQPSPVTDAQASPGDAAANEAGQ